MEAQGGDPGPITSEPLLGLQLGSREATYAAAYPLAHDYIVSRWADRVPVARFLVDWSSQRAPVVYGIDVAVHPARRAGAVGFWLLRAWVRTCDWLERPAQLHVVPHNPARRLYRRLGFVETDPTAFPLPMRREPRQRA
jgi:GNAT superfamily N-acetyltransferase